MRNIQKVKIGYKSCSILFYNNICCQGIDRYVNFDKYTNHANMHLAPYLLHCHSFKWWSYFFFLPPPFFLGGLFLPPTAASFTTFSGLDCLPTATWVSSFSILALIVTSSPLLNIIKNSLIIHKERAKEINV